MYRLKKITHRLSISLFYCVPYVFIAPYVYWEDCCVVGLVLSSWTSFASVTGALDSSNTFHYFFPILLVIIIARNYDQRRPTGQECFVFISVLSLPRPLSVYTYTYMPLLSLLFLADLFYSTRGVLYVQQRGNVTFPPCGRRYRGHCLFGLRGHFPTRAIQDIRSESAESLLSAVALNPCVMLSTLCCPPPWFP